MNAALEPFYEKLAKTKDLGWVVGSHARTIRCTGRSYLVCACPLAVVTGINSYSAPESLGLSEAWGDCIRDAADNCRLYDPRVSAIRSRMLEILGLQEVQP